MMKIGHVFGIVTAGLLLVSIALPAQQAEKPAPAKASASGQATGHDIQVLKMVLCRDVKDREPQEELNTAKVGDMVVGWTQVKAPADIKVIHRWILDGKTVKEIPLEIKGGGPYRSWSKKTVVHPGNWKWQVIDSGGNVLKEVSFTAS